MLFQSANDTAVVADSSNSIYVFGETSGNLDGNTVKYDSAGNKQWTQLALLHRR